MNSKIRSLFALFVVAAPLLGSVAGCNQADNPTPVAAPPPPPPKEEELKVPKGPGDKAYGSGSAYQKAMERANKQGAQ
jgi:hypothetical protein